MTFFFFFERLSQTFVPYQHLSGVVVNMFALHRKEPRFDVGNRLKPSLKGVIRWCTPSTGLKSR